MSDGVASAAPPSSDRETVQFAPLPPELAELSQEELALAARAFQKNKERNAKKSEQKRANATKLNERIDNIDKALEVLAQAKKDQTPTEEQP